MAKPRAMNLTLDLVPPSPGHTAIFKLIKPDTTVITKSLLTDQTGTAVAQFSLGPKYKAGMYRGRVDVDVDGQKVYAENSMII